MMNKYLKLLSLCIMKNNIIKSHLKKKSQSKLALSISLFIVLLTSTGYIFNSKGIIFLFYIFYMYLSIQDLKKVFHYKIQADYIKK